jgi:hypothetical protein
MKRTFTFEQFIQYGIEAGGNIVNGMPWSFTFNGFPVTHETDDAYLICLPAYPHDFRFERGQTITVDEETNTMSIDNTPQRVQQMLDRQIPSKGPLVL